MKINTTRFGEIEFPEEVLIDFPDGILGFPAERRYVLLEHDVDDSPFKWLQSADNPDLAFIVVDPMLILEAYPIMIDMDTARMIGTQKVADCALMAIVNVPSESPASMTVNLKAPLVVNSDERKGRQIIIGSQTYSVNEPVFPRLSQRLAELAASQATAEAGEAAQAATA